MTPTLDQIIAGGKLPQSDGKNDKGCYIPPSKTKNLDMRSLRIAKDTFTNFRVVCTNTDPNKTIRLILGYAGANATLTSDLARIIGIADGATIVSATNSPTVNVDRQGANAVKISTFNILTELGATITQIGLRSNNTVNGQIAQATFAMAISTANTDINFDLDTKTGQTLYCDGCGGTNNNMNPTHIYNVCAPLPIGKYDFIYMDLPTATDAEAVDFTIQLNYNGISMAGTFGEENPGSVN